MPRRPWLCFVMLALGGQLVLASHAAAAVTASVVSGTLRVTGDDSPNVMTLRVAAGVTALRIEVLDGTTVVGSFLRIRFSHIVVEGLGGADVILLSRVNGEITEPAMLLGGAGEDTITGGAANDTVNGGPEDDRLIWNPGDGSDFFDGDAGFDTLEINGSNAAETFMIGVTGARVLVTRGPGTPMPTPAVSLDIGSAERLMLTTFGGNDTIACSGDLPPIQLDSGDGDDKLLFNGSNASETFTIAPDESTRESRMRFVRTIGIDDTVVIVDDLEIVEVNALGEDDTFMTAPSLAGTEVTSLILDGGDGNDVINGSDTNDILKGGPGNDHLHGRGGDDTITPGPDIDGLGRGQPPFVDGGEGNDTLIWNDGDGID